MLLAWAARASCTSVHVSHRNLNALPYRRGRRWRGRVAAQDVIRGQGEESAANQVLDFTRNPAVSGIVPGQMVAGQLVPEIAEDGQAAPPLVEGGQVALLD